MPDMGAIFLANGKEKAVGKTELTEAANAGKNDDNEEEDDDEDDGLAVDRLPAGFGIGNVGGSGETVFFGHAAMSFWVLGEKSSGATRASGRRTRRVPPGVNGNA